MTRAGAAALTVLAAAALAAPVHAGFAPPVQLATGKSVVNAAAAADAAGRTTVVATGTAGGPLLFEHPRGGAWSPGMRLPGRPHGVAGPVVDARGRWRARHCVARRQPAQVHGHRRRDARPPRGPLAADRGRRRRRGWRAPPSARRRPRRGRAAGLQQRHRERPSQPAGRGLGRPPQRRRLVLDADRPGPSRLATAGRRPRLRRQRDRGLDARPPRVRRVGGSRRIHRQGQDLRLPDRRRIPRRRGGRRGAATVAWTSHHSVERRTPRTRYYVRAPNRAAGRAFGAVQDVATTTEFIGEIRIAADEAGRATLAWAEDHYGRAPSGGGNGVTSAVRAATARVGRPFAAAREVAARHTRSFTTPAVAAAGGRAALAWGLSPTRTDLGVQAAIGPAGGLGDPQTVVAKRLSPAYYRSPPAIAVALDPNGTATVLYEEPVDVADGSAMTRLMAAEGS